MKLAVLGTTFVLAAGALLMPTALRADDLDDALAALKQAVQSKDAAKVIREKGDAAVLEPAEALRFAVREPPPVGRGQHDR